MNTLTSPTTNPKQVEASTVSEAGPSSPVMPNPSTLPPELPEAWLEQIKSATKGSWWKTALTTILGSSLIATSISFLGDNYRDRQNANREMKKQLQKETVDSYGKLGNEVQTFQAELNNAVITFRYALQTNDKNFDKNVNQAITTVARQIAKVNMALSSPRVTDVDLKKQVNSLFSELPQQLAESQKDKKALTKVIQLCSEKLGKEIDDVKARIEAIRNSVPLES
jgi:hypothetical protein